MQTSTLNRILLFCLIMGLSSYYTHAQVKIGNNPTNLSPGAILEMETLNRGVLLPRVSLSSTTNSAMGPTGNTKNAVVGMVVYNTNAAIVGSATYPANGVGNYTFDGTGWVYSDMPTGGAAGQILTKTTSGITWNTLSSGIVTYSVAGSTGSTGLVVTATGLGVTYSINAATQTLTINVPAGVKLISVRIVETAANCGISASTSILYMTIATDPIDALNTSFLNATIPAVQFYNYAGVPKPIVTRAVRFESATANKFTLSITAMDSYSQYLFLLNF